MEKIVRNAVEYIKNKILASNNRQGISCRKLAASYESETGKHIGKSTVNNILRHKLGFRYLRTCKKSTRYIFFFMLYKNFRQMPNKRI